MTDRGQPVEPAGDLGPVVFVLFGATGDLARRMVLPAFYRLAGEGLLPRQWWLVGNGRGEVTDESFRAHVHDALTKFGPKPEPREWDAFAGRVFFAGGGFSVGSPGRLPDVLGEIRRQLGGDPHASPTASSPPSSRCRWRSRTCTWPSRRPVTAGSPYWPAWLTNGSRPSIKGSVSRT